MTTEPVWLTEARARMGVREIKGLQHESWILRWWKAIKRGGIKDDETPWCAAFVGGCLEAAGIESSRHEAARSYLSWGQPLVEPVLGAVVVFSRDGGGGHVGFVAGRDEQGRLLVLGGNQGDAVNIRPFDSVRVIGYRWPAGLPAPKDPTQLPVFNLAGMPVSRNEA